MVLFEPQVGWSDGSKYTSFEIPLPIDKVVYGRGNRVFEQPVGGEVAALSIAGGVGRKVDILRMSAIRVIAFASERGNFYADLIGSLDKNHSELRPDQLSIGKQGCDFLRTSVRADVEVLWRDTQETISDAASHKKCFMIVIP